MKNFLQVILYRRERWSFPNHGFMESLRLEKASGSAGPARAVRRRKRSRDPTFPPARTSTSPEGIPGEKGLAGISFSHQPKDSPRCSRSGIRTGAGSGGWKGVEEAGAPYPSDLSKGKELRQQREDDAPHSHFPRSCSCFPLEAEQTQRLWKPPGIFLSKKRSSRNSWVILWDFNNILLCLCYLSRCYGRCSWHPIMPWNPSKILFLFSFSQILPSSCYREFLLFPPGSKELLFVL